MYVTYSAILTALCVIPYVRDVLRGTTRPQRVSWFAFATLAIVAAVAQFAAGGGAGAWLAAGSAVGFTTVCILAIRYGTGGSSARDRVCIAVSGIGVVLSIVAGEPLVALVAVVAVEIVATALTARKALVDPGSETLATWLIDAAAGALAIVAVDDVSLGALLYPLHHTIVNLWVAASIVHGGAKTETMQPAKPLVLTVDDEEHITELIAMGLGFNGFEVVRAASGREALSVIDTQHPDLVILDVMLPDLDGLEVVRRLRRRDRDGTKVPVILLTARDATTDKVEGLRLGVDDYVTKPFSIEELIERVRAVLRRSTGGARPGPLLEYHDLSLDEDTREVRRGERLIELTATEHKLLRFLLANARQVLTREQILDAVWEYDFSGNAGVLETYISYLRHKVDIEEPHLIHTVRGVGYSLRLPGGH